MSPQVNKHIFDVKRSKNRQTNHYLKKVVDGQKEKQFNTPRLDEAENKA